MSEQPTAAHVSEQVEILPVPLLADPRFQNLTGRAFALWNVVAYAGQSVADKRSLWFCKCQCGTIRIVNGGSLTRGASTNCGCVKRARDAARWTTHGLSGCAEHRIWKSMKRRCYDHRSTGFANYGGRGIFVCERWRNDCAAFMNDMGPRPSPKHSIERLDNNAGYAPENCIWATKTQQARNTRVNRLLTFGGVQKPMAAWAEEFQVGYWLFWGWIRRGWSEERILAEVRKRKGS